MFISEQPPVQARGCKQIHDGIVCPIYDYVVGSQSHFYQASVRFSGEAKGRGEACCSPTRLLTNIASLWLHSSAPLIIENAWKPTVPVTTRDAFDYVVIS